MSPTSSTIQGSYEAATQTGSRTLVMSMTTSNMSEVANDLSGINTTEIAETETKDDGEAQLWVSPVPDWETAIPIWGVAWDFHVYFFASMFAVLMLVTLWLLANVLMGRKERHKRGKSAKRRGPSRRRMKSLLPPPVYSLIAFAAFLRALCLFVDPYHSTKRLPTALARVFGNLPFTSWVCAYQLLFLALNSALRVEVGTLGWLSKRWLIFSIVLFFMVFNTAVDLILVLAARLRPLLLLCMAANSVWMAVIAAEFAYNAIRLKRRIDETHRTLSSPPGHAMKAMALSGLTAAVTVSPKAESQQQQQQQRRGIRQSVRKLARHLTPSSLHMGRDDSDRTTRTLQLQEHILRTTVLLMLILLVYLSFLLYYLLGTANATPFERLVKPWTWYAVTTCYRTVELVLSIAVLYMLNKSHQKKRMVSDTTDAVMLPGGTQDPTSSMTNGTVFEPPRTSQVEIGGEAVQVQVREKNGEAANGLPAALLSFQRKTLLITAL